tara:strand:- start:396 stop:692 length:297 start_codon:yes stop_codon:yes gene_type:complete
MERVEIHIKMQMMSQLKDLFERDIKTVAKIDSNVNDVKDMQEKLQDKIYSMIEKEEEKEDSYFIFGEVIVKHGNKLRAYAITSKELADIYNSDGETYH